MRSHIRWIMLPSKVLYATLSLLSRSSYMADAHMPRFEALATTESLYAVQQTERHYSHGLPAGLAMVQCPSPICIAIAHTTGALLLMWDISSITPCTLSRPATGPLPSLLSPSSAKLETSGESGQSNLSSLGTDIGQALPLNFRVRP